MRRNLHSEDRETSGTDVSTWGRESQMQLPSLVILFPHYLGDRKGLKLGGQRYFTLSFMSFIKDVHFVAKPETFIDPFHNMADKMLSICLTQLGLL